MEVEVKEALSYLLSLEPEDIFKELTLRDKKLEEYIKKLNKFKGENRSNSKSFIKGGALEELVVFLAESTDFFEVFPNLRTHTNEIDLLLRTKIGAKKLFCQFLSIDTDIIFECKNYNKKVSVTWIGKFHSLLRNQGCKFGVIFSYEGFTGSDWKDATGLVKKIFLKDNILILDFNITDFEKLSSGDNFLNLLCDKIDSIKHDTIHDIDHYCKKHEVEDLLSR